MQLLQDYFVKKNVCSLVWQMFRSIVIWLFDCGTSGIFRRRIIKEELSEKEASESELIKIARFISFPKYFHWPPPNKRRSDRSSDFRFGVPPWFELNFNRLSQSLKTRLSMVDNWLEGTIPIIEHMCSQFSCDECCIPLVLRHKCGFNQHFPVQIELLKQSIRDCRMLFHTGLPIRLGVHTGHIGCFCISKFPHFGTIFMWLKSNDFKMQSIIYLMHFLEIISRKKGNIFDHAISFPNFKLKYCYRPR